jgi:23S rRNA (cytidine1920-2'-O)/16S rRNA (cytidine1409-2'-O)-methyltransferase
VISERKSCCRAAGGTASCGPPFSETRINLGGAPDGVCEWGHVPPARRFGRPRTSTRMGGDARIAGRVRSSLAPMAKTRLDALLAERGLYESRSRAAAAVLAGEVRVEQPGDGLPKPGQMVAADVDVQVERGPSFVSRGGLKLANGLDALRLEPAGRRCLDVGASTGGFTDCLLARGAESVVAVDVGYGELAWSLRTDERVRVLERTNVRTLTAEQVDGPVDLVVADLSFISLRLVLPALTSCATDEADLLPMVKPQFEVGRERLGAGGVVRDPAHRQEAVLQVARAAAHIGWGTAGVVASPLPGPAGNVEFFLWLRRDAPPAHRADIDRAVQEGPQ